jgi:hypothetical protein
VSRYEKRFGVRRRGRGRPRGTTADQEVFVTEGKDRELAKLARTRTLALVIDENRERMRRIYEDEYKWLERNGGSRNGRS